MINSVIEAFMICSKSDYSKGDIVSEFGEMLVYFRRNVCFENVFQVNGFLYNKLINSIVPIFVFIVRILVYKVPISVFIVPDLGFDS